MKGWQQFRIKLYIFSLKVGLYSPEMGWMAEGQI